MVLSRPEILIACCIALWVCVPLSIIVVVLFVFVQNLGFLYVKLSNSGPGSVVGIATAYGLDGPGIKSWWAARFSALVQTDPEVHPASSCTMGTGSFPGARCGRGMTLIPQPLLVPRSKIE